MARGPRSLLDDLDLAHRRGQEPKFLNFTNVATTGIDIAIGASVVAHANVSRTGLNQRTLTPPIDPDELAPDSPGDRGRPADAGAAGPARTFDLTNAFSIDGWYGDAYADLIPDRTETALVLGSAADSFGATQISARLGLETTGITLPLTRVADKVRTPEREASPILVGGSNALVQRLAKIGKAQARRSAARRRRVEVVPRAFGTRLRRSSPAHDAAGTEAAASYLARRVPYVWDNTRGSLLLWLTWRSRPIASCRRARRPDRPARSMSSSTPSSATSRTRPSSPSTSSSTSSRRMRRSKSMSPRSCSAPASRRPPRFRAAASPIR